MKKIKLCLVFASLIVLNSCSDDDNKDLQPESSIENSIQGKWFYYGEEELDEKGNVEDFWDLTEKECQSGFILFQANNIKQEEHAEPDEDCEKYDFPGTWKYDNKTNIITIIDEEDGYIMKGTVVKVDTKELRIKLTQQGDDTDFEDYNTHMVFKKVL